MKKIVLVVVLLNVLVLVFAQRSRALYGGFGWFETGIQQTNLENLNNELKANYSAELNETFISLGGGGYSVIKNLMLGGEGKGFRTNSSSGNNTAITMTGGYGLFDLGYMVYYRQKLSIFPKLGLGAGGITLETAKKNTDFSGALSLGQTSTETYETYLIDVGLGVMYQVSHWMVGIHAGYLYALTDDKWSAADIELSNGPAINLTGVYMKLTIGGGGIGRY
jgi:hypothetical protein